MTLLRAAPKASASPARVAVPRHRQVVPPRTPVPGVVPGALSPSGGLPSERRPTRASNTAPRLGSPVRERHTTSGSPAQTTN